MPEPRLRRSFRFAVCQVVKLGELDGIVTACDYTFAGREIYTVRFDCAEVPVRTVLGEYLNGYDHAPKTRHRRASVLPAAQSLRRSPKVLELAA